MATKYWVGGSGNWSDATKWKTTSGGAVAAGIPTSADTVVFDANSASGDFTVGLNSSVTVLSMTTPVGLNKLVTLSAAGASNVTTGSMSINGANTGCGIKIASGSLVCSGLATATGTGVIQIDGVNFRTGSLSGTSTALVSSVNNGTATITGTGTNIFAVQSANYTGTLPFRVYFTATGTITTSIYVGATNVWQLFINGTGTFSIGPSAAVILSVNFSGFSGIWLVQSGTIIIRDFLNFGVGSTTANSGGSASVTLGTDTELTVHTNGVVVSFNFIINSAGGTFKLLRNLEMNTGNSAGNAISSFTLTAGTLDLNGFSMTVNNFQSSATNTRSILFGTGAITVAGTGAGNLININGTNFTATGTKQLYLTGTTSLSSTNAVTMLSMSETNALNLSSSSSYLMGGSSTFINDWTITAGSISYGTSCPTLYGNLSVSGGSPGNLASNGITFAGTGLQTISIFNNTYAQLLLINKPSGTLRLLSNLTSANTYTATLTSGTLDLNGYTLSTGGFVTTATANVRGIIGNGGKIQVSSQGGSLATVWNSSPTNLTTTGLTVEVSSISPTNTRTITCGAPNEANAISFNIFSSSSTSVGFSAGSVIKDLTIQSGALTSLAGLSTVYGNIVVGYAPTLSTASITLAGSTPQTITSSATSFQVPLVLANTSSAGVKLLSAVIMSTTNSIPAITLTSGLFDLNGFTLTIGIFSSSNTNVRSMNFNGGSIVLVCTNIGGTTLWDVVAAENFSVVGTSDPLVYLNNSTTYARNLSPGTPSESGAVSFYLRPATTSITVTIQSNAAVRNLTANGMFTLANVPLTIYGDYTYTGGFVQSGGNTWTFAKSSGTQTITMNATTYSWPLVKTGSGILQLGSSMFYSGTNPFELTQGTFKTNGFNLTLGGRFTSDNTNVRGIDLTSGDITLTASNLDVWIVHDTTNFTFTGNNSVNLTYSAGVGTRIIYHGDTAKSEAGAVNFTVASSSDILSLFGSAKSLNLSAYAGTLNNNAITVYGNYTLSTSTILAAGNNTTTFGGTTTLKTITTNGKTLAFPVVINGAGSTTQLGGALTMAASRTLTLTAGTFSTANYAVTVDNFNSSGTGVRDLQLGASTWTVTGTGTVWDAATSTNLTVTAGTSNILLSNTSTTTRTFNGGGKTYNKITIGGATGSSATTITDSNTFGEIASTKAVAHSILFQPGTTTTVAAWTANGTAGNMLTISSSSAASHTLAKSGGGTVTVDYAAISYSTATPANTWIATNFTDAGYNSGWSFGGVIISSIVPSSFFMIF